MKYIILIKSHPELSRDSSVIFDFISQIKRAGHRITQIFFMGDGVLYGKHPSSKIWQQVDAPLKLCVNSVLARKLYNKALASEYRKIENISPEFEVATLSHFYEALSESDYCKEFYDS